MTRKLLVSTSGLVAISATPPGPPVTPVATIGDRSVNEADGSVTVTVTMTPTPSGSVSVDFATADGSAVAVADYTATSGTLSFSAGQATRPIVISLTDDADLEGDETFTVNLSNPVGCTIGDAQATITILASDTPIPVLHTFDLTDTSGGGSSGFFRTGLAFEKGDLPAGNLPTVTLDDGTPVRSAVMETNTWSDGSMRKATLVGEVAGGITGTVSLEVSGDAITQATSGVDPVAYLSGNTDFKVEITNHNGTETGAQPNRTFALNDAMAVATRREIQGDNPVCVRAFAWSMPPGEKHLSCLHYVDLWLNTSGSVVGVEWTPVLSQHWWLDNPFGDGGAPKEERNYSASVQDGATVLDQHDNMHHAYYCQWASVRRDDDDHHAKRHWIDKGVAMPTHIPTYSTASRIKFMKTGYIQPVDLTSTYPVIYGGNPDGGGQEGGINFDLADPFFSNGNKIPINAPGGYVGRGVTTGYDGAAITEQTAQKWRSMRVMSQDAFAVYHHAKDHRTAVGGPFNGDVSMGMFPQPVDQQGPQTYPGLAAEALIVSGNGGTLRPDNPSDATQMQAALDARGLSAFSRTGGFRNWDRAHHTVYGYFAAFIQGERYLADSVADQFHHFHTQQQSYGAGFGNLIDIWYTKEERRAAASIPDTPRFGNTYMATAQERELGWAQLSIDHCWALLPDGDRHQQYLKNHLANASALMETSHSRFPSSQIATGTYYMGNPGRLSAFMNGMSSQCFTRSHILHEGQYLGFKQYFELTTKYFRSVFINRPYMSRFNNLHVNVDGRDAVQYIAPGRIFGGNTRTEIDNSNTPGTDFEMSFPQQALGPTVGDKAMVADPNYESKPVEAILSQEYEVISVQHLGGTNYSFRIAKEGTTTPEEWTPSDSSNHAVLHLELATADQNQIGDNGTLAPNDDDFMTIMNASVEYAYGAGSPDISAADMAQIRNFWAPMTYDRFASWNINGDQIRA